MTIPQRSAPPDWTGRVSQLDYAFQPIVHIHTGVTYGFEALLRNTESCGFSSISAFVDAASRAGVLHQVDMELRRTAVEKFARLLKKRTRLFFNLDARIFDSADYQPGDTLAILDAHGLPQDAVCFEISRRRGGRRIAEAVRAYRERGFRIAIDDFGAGPSGFDLLYHCEPDIIKIHRFLITGIDEDARKRLFVESITDVAHRLGVRVVAVGVETKSAYIACREAGVDMIQGDLVQKPVVGQEWLRTKFQKIHLLGQAEERRRGGGDDGRLIRAQIEKVSPVYRDEGIFEVFKRFKDNKDRTFYPVLGRDGEPLGIVREKSFKDYAYSRYGNELLQNPAFGKTIDRFISRFPVVDIRTPAEQILEVYARNSDLEGIIIVDSLKYAGVLSAPALLKILNEKNLGAARELNPVSGLPANAAVYEHLSAALTDTAGRYLLVWLDITHFKAYNARYGYQQGDRVLRLFSELLRRVADEKSAFAGHIGGDDFYLGISDVPAESVRASIAGIIERFARDVESFYDAVAVKTRAIVVREGDGKLRRYPLLTAAAAAIELPAGRLRVHTPAEINRIVEETLVTARSRPDGVAMVRIKAAHRGHPSHRTPNDPDAVREAG